MKEVLSSTLHLTDSLSLSDILSLHQFSKNYNGLFYILVNQELIDPNNLPTLVSSLLTYKCELTFIVEGHNVQDTLAHLQAWVSSDKNVNIKKAFLQQTI